MDGSALGSKLGTSDGAALGTSDGEELGILLGASDGVTLGAKDGDSEGFTTQEFNGCSFVQTPIDPCGPTQAQPALPLIVLQHWFGMPGSQGSPLKGRPPCMRMC